MSLVQCKDCGAMVSDQASACPKCGAPIEPAANGQQYQQPYQQQYQQPYQQPYQQQYQQPAYQQVAPNQPYQAPVNDTPNAGLNVLSFFFPLVGWILWGVNHQTKPNSARACAKWAWIGFAVAFVCSILYGVLVGVAMLDY